MLRITPYKISTITAVSNFSSDLIDLELFFESITPATSACHEGISYVEYCAPKGVVRFKGHHKKLSIVRRKESSGKRFDSQVTVLINLLDGEDVVKVNVKVSFY